MASRLPGLQATAGSLGSIRQTCWPRCSPLHSQSFRQEQDQISEHKSNHHPGRISSDNKVNTQVIKGKMLAKRQNINFFQRRLSEVKAMKGILLTTDFT